MARRTRVVKRRRGFTAQKALLILLFTAALAVLAYAATAMRDQGGSLLDGIVENRIKAEARSKLEQLAPGVKVDDAKVQKAVQEFMKSGKAPAGIPSGVSQADMKRAVGEGKVSKEDIERAKKQLGR